MSTGSQKAKKSSSPKKPTVPAVKASPSSAAPRRSREADELDDDDDDGLVAERSTPKPVIRPRLPRPMSRSSSDDLLLAGASSSGTPFGRCGGRAILSRLERDLCDRLTNLGVAHSHRPRHFEVKLDDESLAAFAPTMVLRGRGREGKTVVLETSESKTDTNVPKIRAFRRQYGLEFYVCLVAPEEVLDEIAFDTYDESTAATDVHTLVSRLAD
jgi:hypothetical protein